MTYPLPANHIGISTRYAYLPTRHGLSLMDLKTGESVFFQPGDEESLIRDEIEPLLMCGNPSAVEEIAASVLGAYF